MIWVTPHGGNYSKSSAATGHAAPSLRREPDRLGVKWALVRGQLQRRSNRIGLLHPVQGIEPRVQPLLGGKEINILADEAHIYLAPLVLDRGHVNQRHCCTRSGRRANFAAKIA